MDPVRRSIRASKARLYYELTLVDATDITESDMRLMKCLMEDSDVQTIFDEALTKEKNGTATKQ